MGLEMDGAHVRVRGMSGVYMYDGLEAELYDCLDELSDFEDIDFYRWFLEASSGEVLDLGCGTGRVLLPLVESGLRVMGLDGSERMLELCGASLRERGLDAELLRGDMRSFDLGERRFGTILIPGFSVQMLLEDEDLAACLACCRRHLADGGQLIVPTHLPWEMIWDGRSSSPLEERRVAERGGTGERLIAYQGWELDTDLQRLRLRNRFERRAADGSTLESEDKEMVIRWHLPHDFMGFLATAGFGDISLYGDFEFEPPEPESDSVVYVARA